MASLGSFSFVIDTSLESPIVNFKRPRLPLFPYGPRKSIDFGLSTNSTLEIGRLSLCCAFSRKWMQGIMGVKATGRGSEEAESAEESDADDALQATIEKSKRVLAMQKDLLQQIAERKKLVSSIKSSIIDSEGGYKDKNGSLSNIAVSSGGDVSEKSISPDGPPVQSSVNEVEDSLSSAIKKDFIEAKREVKRNVPLKGSFTKTNSNKQLEDTASGEVQFDVQSTSPSRSSSTRSPEPSSNINFPKQLNDTSSKKVNSSQKTLSDAKPPKQVKDDTKEAASSDVLSTLSGSLAKPNLKDEKHEDSKEPIVEEGIIDAENPMNKDVKPPPLAGANVMNIILVAAECAPWCKTGGLGDVAGALPKALARRGHRVMVVIPRYANYSEAQETGVRKIYKVEGQDVEVTYFQAYIDGVDFVFVDSHMFRHIENNIYGGNRVDILKRMVLFCKAAVEVPWHVPCGGVCYGDGNLVFIANDWHTALLPVYLKAYYRDHGIMKFTRSILVIHNIAHQGRGPLDDFFYVDLPPQYMDLFRLNDPVGGEHFNIFAAGLKTADRVVTVSHGYAWELKTSEGGWGLHGIINEIDWKLRGIVNGIDMNEWSPEVDIHLKSDGYVNYSLETLQSGKPKCKAALQKELGLPIRDVPLIGFIGRLDNQKGVDLIAEAIPWMMGQDVQLVMLGTGRADLEEMLRKFEGQYSEKIRGWVGFSVKTAHRITAGADILLMPSRFEPCGLNQLYAMRYGTIPVVHAVGGLRDTVKPFDPFNESGFGWTFDRAEANQLIHALGNCLLTYRQFKSSWEGLQRRGLMQDLSWDNAACSYEEVLVAAKYQW